MKQKLDANLRSPLEPGLFAGTSVENTASSLAENTSTWKPSPWASSTTNKGRNVKFFVSPAIPHPSIWDHQWKKAVLSETTPCQVASNPERKTCASKMSRAPWKSGTVRHPQATPAVAQVQPTSTASTRPYGMEQHYCPRSCLCLEPETLSCHPCSQAAYRVTEFHYLYNLFKGDWGRKAPPW